MMRKSRSLDFLSVYYVKNDVYTSKMVRML